MDGQLALGPHNLALQLWTGAPLGLSSSAQVPFILGGTPVAAVEGLFDAPMAAIRDCFEVIRCVHGMDEAERFASLARSVRRFAQLPPNFVTGGEKRYFHEAGNLGTGGLVEGLFKRQVDLAWPGEALCLEGHGFRDSSDVLDVGTGNAYFLCRLGARYRYKRFLGVEPNAQFLHDARRNAQRLGVDNVALSGGRCPDTVLGQSFDFAYSRLGVHQMQDRMAALMWMREYLRPGGRACIIDVDDDSPYFHTYPPPFQKLFLALRKMVEGNGGDRVIAHKLPDMLRDAGFDDIRFETRYWYSTTEMSVANFASLWELTAYVLFKTAPGDFTADDFHEVMIFLGRMRMGEKHVLRVPLFYISGQKR
jgi:ubiquinone/menaquinone biosynthesis C-methylase UbiE